MSHAIRHKQKLLHRVSRIGGQVEAIKRALEGEAGCSEVMHLIAGCRGAINGLLAEVVEDHIRTHLMDRAVHLGSLEGKATDKLVDVVHSYFK